MMTSINFLDVLLLLLSPPALPSVVHGALAHLQAFRAEMPRSVLFCVAVYDQDGANYGCAHSHALVFFFFNGVQHLSILARVERRDFGN